MGTHVFSVALPKGFSISKTSSAAPRTWPILFSPPREVSVRPGRAGGNWLLNGANIAASVLLRRPEAIRTAILLRAMVPFEPEQLPDLAGVRVWIAGGTEDMIIPRANTERLATILSDAGAEVTARFFAAGHGLTSAELVLAKRWLESIATSADR